MNASLSRLPAVAESNDTRVRELLDETARQLGRVPNLYRTMANSRAALAGYLAFRSALVTGKLDAKTREHIALFVAQLNGCTYCVSAHGLRLTKLGATEADILAVRRGQVDEGREQAILSLVKALVERRGDISDEQLEAARAAGVSNEEVAEVVAHVALNVFSNFFNHVARPELDFPLREARDV